MCGWVLQANEITDAGAVDLALALGRNTTLQELHIEVSACLIYLAQQCSKRIESNRSESKRPSHRSVGISDWQRWRHCTGSCTWQRDGELDVARSACTCVPPTRQMQSTLERLLIERWIVCRTRTLAIEELSQSRMPWRHRTPRCESYAWEYVRSDARSSSNARSLARWLVPNPTARVGFTYWQQRRESSRQGSIVQSNATGTGVAGSLPCVAGYRSLPVSRTDVDMMESCRSGVEYEDHGRRRSSVG